MKRKMVLGAILTVLLVLQAQSVFAAPNDDARKAIEKNDLRNLEKVLQRNAQKVDLQSRLFQAIIADKLEAIKLLVRYGADVNRPVTNNWYALPVAVVRENIVLARYFIEAGG